MKLRVSYIIFFYFLFNDYVYLFHTPISPAPDPHLLHLPICFLYLWAWGFGLFCFVLFCFVLFGGGGICGMQKFLGQGSNPNYSSGPSRGSDYARSLTHYTTRETHDLGLGFCCFYLDSIYKGDHVVFVSVQLISLNAFEVHPCCHNGKISFFL